MKAVILAGGLGTRLSEETHLKPKPMVEIGGKPILWHILKIYSSHGINEFIICCGYKGYLIKEYFANYFLHMSNVTIDLSNNTTEVHEEFSEPWKITLIDTGLETSTAGRLKKVAKYIKNEDFCFTYGDGLSDVNIKKLIDFHKNHQKIATVTAVKPAPRFGALSIKNEEVISFEEKPSGEGGWINGGFFVLSEGVLDYIYDEKISFEDGALVNLAKAKEIVPFYHEDFWHPMDTLKDKRYLESSWNNKKAPWKTW